MDRTYRLSTSLNPVHGQDIAGGGNVPGHVRNHDLYADQERRFGNHEPATPTKFTRRIPFDDAGLCPTIPVGIALQPAVALSTPISRLEMAR
jgi:hypothetical protein